MFKASVAVISFTKPLGLCSAFLAASVLSFASPASASDYETMISTLYKAAPEGVETRWVSPENPDGARGAGGRTNKGAKGDAYVLIAPGERKVIFDQEGAGIITKIWSANNMRFWSAEERRKVSIHMYWDDAEKPAVSAPFSEFFGVGLGQMRTFENTLFASPEGRSHNAFIPMPYRTSARVEIHNESEEIIMFYYKINFLKVPSHPDDVLYFHAHWRRDPSTKLGVDFEILPRVKGRGRFLGSSLGVIGNPAYRTTWFGEGEVKIYLDGDDALPTLVGTGTEDYIGTGWGQEEFVGDFQGSLISNKKHDLYAFYRFHTVDPVYFSEDIRVTIQQIGNAVKRKLLKMRKNGTEITPVWSYVKSDGMDASKRYLDMEDPPELDSDEFPDGVSTNFYRSDDVSAVAYFYLDSPTSTLPPLQDVYQRVRFMAERVDEAIGD